MAKLERAWRALGVGLFFILIGVGGTLLAVSVFPLIACLTREKSLRQHRIQGVLHQVMRLYCRAIHVLRVSDVVFLRTEQLRHLKGTLIIANHPSLLDVAMVMAAVPSVQCVVKAGLWRNPFFRLTVSGAGYIRNDLPPEQLLEACVAALRSGKNLIIFPEGTRTPLPLHVLSSLHRGFASVAITAAADLQLVTITCDPPLLHKGSVWWRAPKRRTRFCIDGGERLAINAFLEYPFRSLGARHLVAFVEHYYSEKLTYGYAGARDQASDRLGLEAGGSVPG